MFHGYELTSEWKNSTSGKIAFAERGGKKFFIKIYQTPVKPINNGALDAKTIANNERLFEEFVSLRRRVNNTLRPIAGAGGNIIIPCDDFIDDNHYCEVSEFVENSVPREETEAVLASLPVASKLLLMKTAAAAMVSVHNRGVIHSDLKLENLLLAKLSSGNYVAKMVDFDSSFFEDQKPDELIGTINFYSPELGTYACSEDDAEEMKKFVGEKTDIFSLGLIYHLYLSGEFPEAVRLTERLQKQKDKGKKIYPWVALNNGCALKFSPKITENKYIALIADMLRWDQNRRPRASEVLTRLQMPDSTPLAMATPAPEHGISWDRAKLAAAQVIRIEIVEVESEKKYEVLYKTGEVDLFTKEEIQERGLATTAAPAEFCAPWEEHGIVFDEAALRTRGFISCEQETISGIKGYKMYRADGSAQFIRMEMLLTLKCATRTGGGTAPAATTTEPRVVEDAESIGFETPWEEHDIVFDEEVTKAKGFVGIRRKTLNTVNGYELIRANGTLQFIRKELLLVQKMAKPK